MALYFVIDRFEGDFGVCLADENDAGIYKIDVPRSQLDGFFEGDVFSATLEGENVIDIVACPEESAKRKAAAKAKLQ